MDERLRILLRQYMQTGAADDGIRFANEAVRAGAETPEIWIMTWFEGSDNGSDYEVFYTRRAAFRQAAKFAEIWLRQSGLAQNHEIERELLAEIEALNAKGRYEAAVTSFNDLMTHRTVNLSVDKVVFEEDKPQFTFKYPDAPKRRQNPVAKPNDKHFRAYKKFVIYAVLGKLREADQMYGKNQTSIHKMADYLKDAHPIAPRTIYRGMLIPARDVPANRIATTPPGVKFVSFSEDVQVACWFAATDTVMAEAVLMQYPDAVGWIGEMIPQLDDILFHHSWVDALNQDPKTSLYQTALDMQSQLGLDDAVMQIRYHMMHQKEVICTANVTYPLRPASDYQCLPVRQLDSRYIPHNDFIIAPPGLEPIGIRAGTRLNIERVDHYRPSRQCHKCRRPAVMYTYILEGTDLVVDICENCKYVFYVAP